MEGRTVLVQIDRKGIISSQGRVMRDEDRNVFGRCAEWVKRWELRPVVDRRLSCQLGWQIKCKVHATYLPG